MDPEKKPFVIVAVVSALLGAGLASAAFAFASPATGKAASVGSASSAPVDDDALAKANAALVASLSECDRRLVDLGQAPTLTPTPTGAQPSAVVAEEGPRGDGGRRGGRRGGEPTKEDWEKMAESGTLRVRVPCIRDTPWKPNENAQDRLGLAPQDADTIRDAYAESNKRMVAEIRPLCGKVLGSPDIIDRVGADTCVDAILNAGKKQNPEAAKGAIVATAEVNAGKRKPNVGDDPMEKLLYAMTQETKAFEADLAKKLGPEEAKRLAWAPEMCADRRVVRSGDEPDGPRRGGGGGGGGRPRGGSERP